MFDIYQEYKQQSIIVKEEKYQMFTLIRQKLYFLIKDIELNKKSNLLNSYLVRSFCLGNLVQKYVHFQ